MPLTGKGLRLFMKTDSTDQPLIHRHAGGGNRRSTPRLGLRRGPVAALVVAFFAGPILAAPGLAVGAPSPIGAGCTDTWTDLSGGNWSTAMDWSNHAVPGPTAVACITRSGRQSYVVTLGQGTGGVSVGSLRVGTATGHTTETLLVEASANTDIHLSLSQTSTVAAEGRLELTTGKGGGNDFVQGAGTLVNSGRIDLLAGAGWSRYLYGNIVNNRTGTIDVAAANLPGGATYEGTSTSLVNMGKIVVAAGSSWDVSGTGYTQTASGAVVNHGTVVFNDSTIHNEGGTSTGNTWLLRNGGTIDEAATAGPASYTVQDSATLEGNIPKGQTISVDGANGGDDRLALDGNVANRGTILMTSSADWQGPGNAWILNGGKHTSTLYNQGTLQTLPGVGWSRYFLVNVTNAPAGVIKFGTSKGSTNYFSAQQGYSSTVFTNNGTVRMAAGAVVALEGVSAGQADFVQSASGRLGATASTALPSVLDQYGCSAGGCQHEYVRVGGSLVVSGSASSDYPVISQAAPVSGTFSSVSPPYTATYNVTKGAPSGTVGDVVLSS